MVTKAQYDNAKTKGGEMSSGGMLTKLKSAVYFADKTKGLAVILDGRTENVLRDVFSKKDIGTLIGR